VPQQRLFFRVLGPLQVEGEGGPLALVGRKQRALLTLLLLHPGEVVSSDRLVDELWGEHPPATAATSLRNLVAQLRRRLGAETIVTRPPGYLLEVGDDELDLRRFERLVAEARDADLERAARLLCEALALWRGPAFAEFDESFGRIEARRLEDLRLAALEERIETDLARGRDVELIGELEALVANHPHRERLRAQLMLALYRCGRQADALEAYRDARAALDELGIEPSENLRRLEKAMLTHDTVLQAPPRKLERPTNLPLQATSFVGRQRQLNEIAGLLGREGVRLVTLTGAAGSGKTRLALQVATNLRDDFGDGVFFVNLAEIGDPSLVVPTVAQTLAVRELPGESLEQTLCEHLRERRLLVLLDNFEQLLAGAPSLAVLLAAAPDLKLLVTSRAPLRLAAELEYAVQPLELPDPERLPEAPVLSRYEAVALFVERARAVRADFELGDQNARAVAEICVRLDGLPLAIELAAARVRALTPQALLRRLVRRLPLLTGGALDAPARQQTLRGAIDWSYALLGEPQQRLLARLSVFDGGCDMEAAEAVCDSDATSGLDVLGGISSLIENSLLREQDDPAGEPRYSMLETIREYASEELEASAEADALRRRHVEHFLALAERAARTMTKEEIALADAPEERVRRELANLRAALRWTFEKGEHELALRLASAAAWGWYLECGFTEGRAWVTQALEETEHLQTLERARALSMVARFAKEQGDFGRAEAFHERARALFEQYHDRRGVIESLLRLTEVAYSLGDLQRARGLLNAAGKRADEAGSDYAYARADLCFVSAAVEGFSGDFGAAQALLEEGLRLCRELGMPRRLWLHQLINVGFIALNQQDFARARAALEEYLDADSWRTSLGIAIAHENLGLVALYEGDREEAALQFRQALALARDAGAKPFIAEVVYGLAAVAAIDGAPERSARLWGAGDAIRQSTGSPLTPDEQSLVERYLEPAKAKLAPDVHETARAKGGSMRPDDALTYALEQSQLGARP
jgi:predicted ATPase/DNA-binding SARP family transcriptional activator